MLKCKLERMNLSLHHSDSAGKIIIEAKIERDEFSVCNKMRTQFIKLEIKFVRAHFEIAKSFPTGVANHSVLGLLSLEWSPNLTRTWLKIEEKVMLYLYMHWNKTNSFCSSPYIALTEKRRLCFPSILWSVSSRDIILPFEQQKGNVASASKLRTV